MHTHMSYKNLTTCRKSVNKPLTSCVRTACPKLLTSLGQLDRNIRPGNPDADFWNKICNKVDNSDNTRLQQDGMLYHN